MRRVMQLGIPKETFPGEQRVSLTPHVIPSLAKQGVQVAIEAGAGDSAGFRDSDYAEKGAKVVNDRQELFAQSEAIAQVRGYGANQQEGQADLALFREGQLLVAFLDPLSHPQAAQKLAEKGVSALSMELIPRTTRAQSMDALSSMATVAGYKAVLIAASALPQMFPMMMTAAGTVTPVRVFVIGAAVAGLQAIATARRLGAVVQSYDVRPAAAEAVKSLGAKFVDLPMEAEDAEDKGGYAKAQGEDFYRRQREMMMEVVADSDVVICTAAIPGKTAPVLVTEEMVQRMAPSSVIVDLAAERGGNCELTEAGETVVRHGVQIFGPIDLAASVPFDASQMYARNVSNLLLHLVKEEKLSLDTEDEIVAGTLLAHGGKVVHPRVQEALANE